MKIQIIIEYETGEDAITHEVACLKGSKRFGFVKTYDEKPKRRLFETLKSQGFQFNQQITFLSDGGESVRDLQLYMSPQAEHVLDWFHVTMRITNMKQMSKRLVSYKDFESLEKNLERIKWFLWHGNVFKSLQVLDDIAGRHGQISPGPNHR